MHPSPQPASPFANFHDSHPLPNLGHNAPPSLPPTTLQSGSHIHSHPSSSVLIVLARREGIARLMCPSPGIASCYDTSCPVPLRFESHKRYGRDSSACDYRWMIEAPLSTCGISVCNVDETLSKGECGQQEVCGVCETPSSCWQAPGNLSAEECTTKFACMHTDGSIVCASPLGACVATL